MNADSPNRSEPEFVSQQTWDARRYYLNLNPDPQEPLTVVCGGVERMKPDYVVARQDFPFYAVEMVTEGAGRLWLGRNSFPLTPGQIFCYGPGKPHRIENHSPEGMRKYYVDFAGHQAPSLMESAHLFFHHPVLVSSSWDLSEIFDLIDREAREASHDSAEICSQLLRLLFMKLKQRQVSQRQYVLTAFATYQQARRVMEQRYLEFSRIEDVARELDVTAVYLSRLFHKYADLGAYQFLLRLRMNYAAERMLVDGLQVKQVAKLLGYADAFQFSRAFKRTFGIAPRTFLDAQR